MSEERTNVSFSIIIPSYKSVHLEAVLDGVRPLDPIEILIVDSSESPPSVAASNVRIIHLPEQATPGKARNEGARRAKGDFLLFVDSDIVFTEKTRAFLKAWLADPSYGAILCGTYARDHEGAGYFTRLQNRIVAYRYELCHRMKSGVGGTAHMLIQRADFERVGGFNEYLETYEDFEFVARARHFGVSTQVEPKFEAVHLKEYSFISLLQDYWTKSYNAIQARRRYPMIFRRIPSNLGLIAPTWLATAALPLLLLSLFFVPAHGFVAGAAGLIAVSPVVLWKPMFPGDTFLFRLRALAVWPALALTVASASGLSLLHALQTALRMNLVASLDYLRALKRVVIRNGWPVQIINYVTARCNLRCKHCFYLDTLDQKDDGELSLETLERTMREIGPVLWYSLAGGEPFLRGDLVEIVDLVQTHCRPKAFTIPTNGWYAERTFGATLRMLQVMKRGNLMLFFSLDGPKDIHDAIRGEGSYERVGETARRLRPLKKSFSNLYLSVVTTVTPGNAHVFPDFIGDVVREFEPNAISINLFRYHSPEHPPVPETVIDAHAAAMERYAEHVRRGALENFGLAGGRLLRAKEFVQKEAIQKVARTDSFVTPCTAGSLSYVIMEDGRVSPCEILPDTIGSIEGDDGTPLNAMICSEVAKELRKRIKTTKCRCTYECAMSTNSLFSWPLAGRLLRRYIGGFFNGR